MSTQAHITAADLERATFAVDVRDCNPNGRGINESTGITVCFTLKSGSTVAASTAAAIKTPYALLMHKTMASKSLQGTLRGLLLHRCKTSNLTDELLFETLGLMV